MTTVFLIEKVCYICGGKNRFPESGPAFSMDSSRDLDGRPSHMGRASIYMSIQRCIHCGYCSPDVAKGEHQFHAIVNQSSYTSQLHNSDNPETANAFLCYATLLEGIEEWSEAGWCALHAAWICDDNSFQESARTCREKAYNLFLKTREQNQSFADSKAEEEILLVDILRRLGKFEKAKDCAQSALSHFEENENVACALTYELHLIDNNDSRCRTYAHAEEFEDSTN